MNTLVLVSGVQEKYWEYREGVVYSVGEGI